MSNFTQIEFGTRAKRESSFVWIYARNCKSYEGYPHNNIPNTTLVLTQMRWDGYLGTVGGLIDPGETPEEAVIREAKEEINFDIDPSKLNPLASFQNEKTKFICHSFSIEVQYEELLRIRDNASTGEHFNAECAGINLAHLCKYPKGKREVGLKILLQQQWSGSSAQELELLSNFPDLVEDYTKYILFLDDDRDVEKYFPKADNVVVCRTCDDAIKVINKRGLPKFISFDHDLGDVHSGAEERTGYTLAKFIVNKMQVEDDKQVFGFQVHSANIEGAKNIETLLNNWFKFIEDEKK